LVQAKAKAKAKAEDEDAGLDLAAEPFRSPLLSPMWAGSQHHSRLDLNVGMFADNRHYDK
jgi:hypothetical protein